MVFWHSQIEGRQFFQGAELCCAVRCQQMVISIDPTKPEEMDFWKAHNPEAYSMVEGAREKLGNRSATCNKILDCKSMEQCFGAELLP